METRSDFDPASPNALKRTTIIGSCLIFALSAGYWISSQAARDGEEATTLLHRQALPDAPGKEAVMIVVTYEPGQASVAHRHPGSVFAYVAEGEVISQLEGQQPVTYKAGQSWYEPPRVPHLVAKNASATRPAKLVAWLLMDVGAIAEEPLRK